MVAMLKLSRSWLEVVQGKLSFVQADLPRNPVAWVIAKDGSNQPWEKMGICVHKP